MDYDWLVLIWTLKPQKNKKETADMAIKPFSFIFKKWMNDFIDICIDNNDNETQIDTNNIYIWLRRIDKEITQKLFQSGSAWFTTTIKINGEPIKAKVYACACNHSSGSRDVFRVFITPLGEIKPLPEKIVLLGHPNPILSAKRGLILVAGPAHSGKTMTLAAITEKIAKSRNARILTLNSLIEYPMPEKIGESLIIQREAVNHYKLDCQYGEIACAPQTGADVVIIDNIINNDSISGAIQLAESCLVIASVPGLTTQQTIEDLIAIFEQQDQARIRTLLARVLRGVICQRIVSGKDGSNLLALEMMLATPAIRKLISENQIYKITSTIQTGHKFGMILLDGFLLELIKGEHITIEEALIHAVNPEEFLEHLKALGLMPA